MKVLILGASGLVGRNALEQTLAHLSITGVIAPTRKPLPAIGRGGDMQELASQLGAHSYIDIDAEDAVSTLRRLCPQQYAAAWHCSSANCRMGRSLEDRRVSIPSFRIL
jgi:nucleoside-diphosphate-sugar epimerase